MSDRGRVERHLQAAAAFATPRPTGRRARAVARRTDARRTPPARRCVVLSREINLRSSNFMQIIIVSELSSFSDTTASILLYPRPRHTHGVVIPSLPTASSYPRHTHDLVILTTMSSAASFPRPQPKIGGCRAAAVTVQVTLLRPEASGPRLR